MFKSVKFILATAAVFSLVACGGGGGGGGSVPPVASTSTFQLRTAYENSVNQTSTLPFTVGGTIGGVGISGSGSATRGNVTATTFEGQSALQKVSSVSATITANGAVAPISTVGTTFVSLGYLPLGSSETTEYEVVVGTATIPTTARINDAGNVYTATRFTSSSKAVTVGTVTRTFTLLPDTAATGVLRVTSVYRNNALTITQTTTTSTRLTPDGAVTPLSETSIQPNGDTLTFTYR